MTKFVGPKEKILNYKKILIVFKGQPILVGTTSIEKSEKIELLRIKIKHNVLMQSSIKKRQI